VRRAAAALAAAAVLGMTAGGFHLAKGASDYADCVLISYTWQQFDDGAIVTALYDPVIGEDDGELFCPAE